MGFGEPKQHIIEITAKGELLKDKLEVGTLCVADPKEFKAWELDFNQQARDERSGQFVQFVSSLNKRPLKIYRNRPQAPTQATRDIAAQQFDEQLEQVQSQHPKHTMVKWLGVIMVIELMIIAGVIARYFFGG